MTHNLQKDTFDHNKTKTKNKHIFDLSPFYIKIYFFSSNMSQMYFFSMTIVRMSQKVLTQPNFFLFTF